LHFLVVKNFGGIHALHIVLDVEILSSRA
jgi:hypothetical protein